MSRIIAGSHRGRRITMPPSDKTRPTTDRVREALFSSIASWANTSARIAEETLEGLAFLDLYAGSGAVGLEAASRGASPVLLVEANRRTAQTAIANVAALGLTAKVRASRVEQVIQSPADRAFDVVFADPPYEVTGEHVEGVLTALVEHGWLADGGLIVVERSRRSMPFGWPAGVTDDWSRRYGETMLYFGHADTGTDTSTVGNDVPAVGSIPADSSRVPLPAAPPPAVSS